MNDRPTIGFVCTWPVYQGATIDRQVYSLIQGTGAAAHQHECRATGNHSSYERLWPVPGPAPKG